MLYFSMQFRLRHKTRLYPCVDTYMYILPDECNTSVYIALYLFILKEFFFGKYLIEPRRIKNAQT